MLLMISVFTCGSVKLLSGVHLVLWFATRGTSIIRGASWPWNRHRNTFEDQSKFIFL